MTDNIVTKDIDYYCIHFILYYNIVKINQFGYTSHKMIYKSQGRKHQPRRKIKSNYKNNNTPTIAKRSCHMIGQKIMEGYMK